jgi:hypothetical protein
MLEYRRAKIPGGAFTVNTFRYGKYNGLQGPNRC